MPGQTTSSTTTTQTFVPVTNPLTTVENWAPILALIVAVSIVIGLFTKHVTSRLADFKDAHKPVHDNVEARLTDMAHKLNGERMRVNALESFRNADIERIVKLETNLHNIEKGQERIEEAVGKNHQETLNAIKQWADQFSQSIREVRDVKPRGG